MTSPPRIVVYEDDVSSMSSKYPLGQSYPLTFVYVHNPNSPWQFKDVEPHLKEERFFHADTKVLDLPVRVMRDVKSHTPPEADVYFVDGLGQGKVLYALLEKLPQPPRTIINSHDNLSSLNLHAYNKPSRAIEASDLEWISQITQQVTETRTNKATRRKRR